MKIKLIAAALVAGLASPAAASTILDFTSSGIDTPGGVSGFVQGTTYDITGSGALNNATHDNNIGCTGEGWNFACDAVGTSYDVGFGVQGGGNNNEVDGFNQGIEQNEYVQVTFGKVLKILGFAGMLTYDDSQTTGGTETVILEYSSDGGGTFNSVAATALFNDSETDGAPDDDDTFGTVGLAFRNDLSLFADVVRFKAGGTSPFDDLNANITAAALEVAPVPVPAALPLLLAGVGALGWAARRKRRMAI